MTFVVARRFGQRIVVSSDTKMTDAGGITRPDQKGANLAHNYIPGRLKAFPLSTKISVAYAGRSVVALDAIRQAYASFDLLTDVEPIVAKLGERSIGKEVDFLLISHVNGPEIYKIADGRVFTGQDLQWIGDAEIATLLTNSIEERRELQRNAWGGSDPGIPVEISEEQLFTSGWSDLLLTAPTLTNSVGGLPVSLLCSPYGHCFNSFAGAYNAGPITIHPDGLTTNEVGEPVDPLYNQYSYSFVTGPYRGAPVLGVWLQESGRAYVYDPMIADEPKDIRGATIDDLNNAVTQRGFDLGGVIDDGG